VNPDHARLTDASFMEKVPLAILVFLLAFAGIYPGWMIRLIEYSLGPVMVQLQQATALPPI